jgi:hypothetical protein
MTAPFDTLKLARRFEAAGFDPKQAGDMSEAIAEATASADLATKRDLGDLGKDLKLWLGGMLIVAVAILLTGMGTVTTIILNRLAATAISAPATRTSLEPANIVLTAAERPYSCRLLDDEQRKCAFGSCDVRTVDRLCKECLRDGGRP